MKRLSAVAVALLIGVSSVSASWDYFPVIEEGSAEVKIASDESIKIRYGLIENLELFAANGADGACSEYAIGARYQIIPAFSAFLDIGIPHSSATDLGLIPGVQFSTDFTETISLGVGARLGVDLNHITKIFDPITEITTNGDEETLINLKAGLELDISLSDQVLFWVGVDFVYDDLTGDGDLEIKNALQPAIGFTFSKDNLSVGTSLGINLADTNRDGKESIGLVGGVDFSIKF